MLDVLDQMEFDIIEIDKTVPAGIAGHHHHLQRQERPVRPVSGPLHFHHIAFPDPDMMRRIVRVHFPDIDGDLVENSIAASTGAAGRGC